jgi:hypothetical protein
MLSASSVIAIFSIGTANALVLLRVIQLWENNQVMTKSKYLSLEYRLNLSRPDSQEIDVDWVLPEFRHYLHIDDYHRCKIEPYVNQSVIVFVFL